MPILCIIKSSFYELPPGWKCIEMTFGKRFSLKTEDLTFNMNSGLPSRSDSPLAGS